MGELGATVMVYPATWKTLPVTIFALTDRGQAFQAAACTTILLLVTLVALVRSDAGRRLGFRGRDSPCVCSRESAYFNSGSRGRPRMRSAMVFLVISDVPPAMVMARLPR